MCGDGRTMLCDGVCVWRIQYPVHWCTLYTFVYICAVSQWNKVSNVSETRSGPTAPLPLLFGQRYCCVKLRKAQASCPYAVENAVFFHSQETGIKIKQILNWSLGHMNWSSYGFLFGTSVSNWCSPNQARPCNSCIASCRGPREVQVGDQARKHTWMIWMILWMCGLRIVSKFMVVLPQWFVLDCSCLDCGICVLWSWARSVGWSDFVELAIVKRAWKLSTGGLWTLWTFGQKYWLTLKFSLQ